MTPDEVGKLLIDHGHDMLDALAVKRAMCYAAHTKDEKIKACVGADTMFRWQIWKEAK